MPEYKTIVMMIKETKTENILRNRNCRKGGMAALQVILLHLPLKFAGVGFI